MNFHFFSASGLCQGPLPIILWVMSERGRVLKSLSGRPLWGSYTFDFLDSKCPTARPKVLWSATISNTLAN